MKQVLIRRGEIVVEKVPEPVVEAGSVLVEVDHSAISTGTETRGITEAEQPLWRRAVQDANAVRRGLQIVATEGIARARDIVEGRLATSQPAGYSAAGTVIAVGAGVTGVAVGDRVACAGAQFAHHAEVICVGRNLVAPIPGDLDFPAASTVALGAIALQGVRRASPTLGETVVVIGLGIIGQLAAQMARVAGCRVIGADLNRMRCERATALGAWATLDQSGDAAVDEVQRRTGGIGADAVIITAASPSSEIVSSAFRMCRRKGRVVVVGDVGLDLRRADFYSKEIDLLISSSYGPGRYDREYEENGVDYPIGYVRWTEQRNMRAYLELVAEGKVAVEPLIDAVVEVERAGEAYARLRAEGTPPPPLLLLLRYPRESRGAPQRRIEVRAVAQALKDRVRLAVIGAGAFAQGTHLPNISKMSDRAELAAVSCRHGERALDVARRFGARYATTDARQILDDAEIDAVVIATRHDRHAELVLEALRRGKHVLVEKPLALRPAELDEIEAFHESAESPPLLMTGFNRRFSPYASAIKHALGAQRGPLTINYRMNAGRLPPDHWVHGPEGGGRNLGEACHIYDLFTFLTGSGIAEVTAHGAGSFEAGIDRRENFIATIRFDDGSVASLTYTALGSTEFPKETGEVFADGAVFAVEDYRRLSVYGSREKALTTRVAEKGHREALSAFVDAIRTGAPSPIPLWQQIQATRIALLVDHALGVGIPA